MNLQNLRNRIQALRDDARHALSTGNFTMHSAPYLVGQVDTCAIMLKMIKDEEEKPSIRVCTGCGSLEHSAHHQLGCPRPGFTDNLGACLKRKEADA